MRTAEDCIQRVATEAINHMRVSHNGQTVDDAISDWVFSHVLSGEDAERVFALINLRLARPAI